MTLSTHQHFALTQTAPQSKGMFNLLTPTTDNSLKTSFFTGHAINKKELAMSLNSFFSRVAANGEITHITPETKAAMKILASNGVSLIEQRIKIRPKVLSHLHHFGVNSCHPAKDKLKSSIPLHSYKKPSHMLLLQFELIRPINGIGNDIVLTGMAVLTGDVNSLKPVYEYNMRVCNKTSFEKMLTTHQPKTHEFLWHNDSWKENMAVVQKTTPAIINVPNEENDSEWTITKLNSTPSQVEATKSTDTESDKLLTTFGKFVAMFKMNETIVAKKADVFYEVLDAELEQTTSARSNKENTDIILLIRPLGSKTASAEEISYKTATVFYLKGI